MNEYLLTPDIFTPNPVNKPKLL